MTKLQERRLRFLRYIMKSYGIEKNDTYIMSIFDIAYHLNNCWYSRHFLSEKRMDSIPYAALDRSNFALRSYDLGLLFTAIRHTVRNDMMFEYDRGGNRVEYVTWHKWKDVINE